MRMRPRSLVVAVFAAAALSARAEAPKAYSGHGAASVTPELLARFAPKPLPSEVSRRIEAMLDLRAPGGAVLAPDGRSLYFNWSVTGTNQVWRLDGPNHFPVQLTGGEDATSVVDVTPDGKRLILSRDRKGEENPGLYLQDPAGGALELVQHTPNVQTFYELISDDGRYLYYRANDLKPDAYALYRYDLAAHKAERIFDQDGLWSIAGRPRDGKLLLEKHTGELTSEYWELDPSNKQLSPIIGQNEKEEYRAEYSARAGELLVLTPKLGNFRRLYRFAGGKLTAITPELKHDVSDFSIDDKRQRIYYQVNDDGFFHPHALDAQSFAELKLPSFPGADSTVVRGISRDGRYIVFGVENARAPTRSLVYDWKSKKSVEWVVPSVPEVDTRRFAVAKLESYPARDGTPIPMLVRRPEACAQPNSGCPVVVLFHGGPEGQARPGFAPGAQLFVDAGFVWVEPNVRGSDGFGKAWLHADDGPKRLEVITDIEDCAKFIRTAWAHDGRAPKIGIYGGSYGGYSVLVGMTMFAGAYDAGVEIVGISNLVTFLKNTAPYRRILRASEYGDPDKDLEALRKLSPITYIDRLKAPLLLIQGASDPRVPVGEAVQMYEALKARKVDSKLIIFPDEGHGAQKRGNRAIQYGEAIHFFETHLKDKPVATR
jgi:dipeptidyl aminopeptidase/acylaminoacyl peptidase